jgi:flagellar basal body-associated protein FliL
MSKFKRRELIMIYIIIILISAVALLGFFVFIHKSANVKCKTSALGPDNETFPITTSIQSQHSQPVVPINQSR